MLVSCVFCASRRRHTRCYRDWSSDVCSSDLSTGGLRVEQQRVARMLGGRLDIPDRPAQAHILRLQRGEDRSEEPRVGKECRSRWSPDHEKKKKVTWKECSMCEWIVEEHQWYR